MFSVLTNSNKMSLGEGLGGWSGNRGMRNQIKKESVGMFTKRKIKVEDVQDYTLEAARRMDIVGDDFGSPIVKFPRGKDFQIEGGVNYGTSTASLGPLGKPLLYLNDNVTGGVRSVSEPESRKSVYNIPLGMASLGKQQFATIDQVRIVKGPALGTFKNELLNVSVRPTHVYMVKQDAVPFNLDVNSSVRDKLLNVSAQATYSDSNNHVPHSYTEHSITLKDQPKVTFTPSEHIERDTRAHSYTEHSITLKDQPKVTFTPIEHIERDTRAHSYTENSITLKDAQPKVTFMPSEQIQKDTRIKDVSYTMKNPRLSLSGYEIKAPYYLKHC